MPAAAGARRAWPLAAGAAAALAALGLGAWLRARRRRRLALRLGCPYAEAAAREAALRRALAVDDAAPVQWADFHAMDWDLLLAAGGHRRRCSCLYLRAGLVRKAMLAHYMTKRKVAGVLPEGLVLDLEDEDDLADLRRRLEEWQPKLVTGDGPGSDGGLPIWIAKASCSNRGEHIFLACSVDEVIGPLRTAVLEEGIPEWVVQRYISSPILVKGRKFHVRAHFLVNGCPHCGKTSAWLHGAGHVVLLAGDDYRPHSTDRLSHLTNHCIQMTHAGYDEELQTLLLSELDAATNRAGLAATVESQMRRALAEALASAASAPAGFAPLPQCFELFGADFVLEDRGAADPGVWLLEVNSGPDLAVFGSRLRPRCVDLLEDVLRVAVEPYLDGGAGAFAEPGACGCAARALGRGFAALWSSGPRAATAAEELAALKRRVGLAGRWARALHEGSGVRVRGPQGRGR